MDADLLTTILVIYFGMGFLSFMKLTGDYKYGKKEALVESTLWPLIVVAMLLLAVILLIWGAASRIFSRRTCDTSVKVVAS